MAFIRRSSTFGVPQGGLFEPIIGFYLRPSVVGRVLSAQFWRKFLEIESAVAIKIAHFNRYQTLDVMRAVCESGRPITVYTGNDDNIVLDLRTPYSFSSGGKKEELRMKGGMLRHWTVSTKTALSLLIDCKEALGSSGAACSVGFRRF